MVECSEVQRLERRADAASLPAGGHDRRPPRSPDRLLRDACTIRDLLDDLDADDHVTRTKLLVARDTVRLEAARQWRHRGWRPITEAF